MAESETVPSTSDRRIENNVMRHEYKILSDGEKAQMQAIKDAGLAFWELIHSLGHHQHRHGDQSEYVGSRELSLAKTKVEEAVMWSVKHLTR